MGTIELRERTVEIGGYERDDGNIRMVVMPRRIRIREYAEGQVGMRMVLSFAAGAALFGILLARQVDGYYRLASDTLAACEIWKK